MTNTDVAGETTPRFNSVTPEDSENTTDFRVVYVPPHRMAPLKKCWMEIYTPIVKYMKLQIRMNVPRKRVELRTCDSTNDLASIQKCADFVHAFMLGFEIKDSIALLRLDDLYIESFDIKDSMFYECGMDH